MAIRTKKITATTVLKGSQPSEALPVISKDFNSLVDDVEDLYDQVTGGTGDITTDDLTVNDDATITGDLSVSGTTTTVAITASGKVTTPAGTVSSPGLVVGANDNGIYEVSATQQGFTVGNTLVGGFNSTGLFADVVSEQTSTVGVTIDGALIKDGSFTGKQATATATADGLTTGALTGTDQFVSVTSANANNIIALPLDADCPIGTVIRGWVGANGFELRSNAADVTLTINAVTAGTTNEAAIPATTKFKVEKVAALTWLLTAVDELGAVIAAIVPDAV